MRRDRVKLNLTDISIVRDLIYEDPHLHLLLLIVFLLPAVLAFLWWRSLYQIRPGNPGNIRRFISQISIPYVCCFIGVAVFAALFCCMDGVPSSFASGDIGILVAELPRQTDIAQQIKYQTAIIDGLQNHPDLQHIVKVELLERPLPFDLNDQQSAALKIGQWLNASFVLRPFAVEGVQEPRLTVVKYPDLFTAESPLQKFSTEQLPQLDQLSLPSDMVLLAQTVFALVLARYGSFDKAAKILSDVLDSPKLPPAFNRSTLKIAYGTNLLRSGHAAEAQLAFSEAVTLAPNSAVAHASLGVVST